MPVKVGEIESLFRYPVKSMSGELLQCAELGWHGLEGDRRLALRRAGGHGGVPWLTASTLRELILFTPLRREASADSDLPTHIRTPEGKELAVFGGDLAADVARRFGETVEMIHLKRGIFDDASISAITSATVDEVCRLSAQKSEVR
ncbi:MAG TPA: MOSC N-terminal beta barrel domain-containing protein, partial [Gemmatimonadaceae bacterium]|nr:MOSC N-terminal beta barrel domain-containing protein [Gemmatimonadaceae bacterium]